MQKQLILRPIAIPLALMHVVVLRTPTPRRRILLVVQGPRCTWSYVCVLRILVDPQLDAGRSPYSKSSNNPPSLSD